jgi:signal transduction histidine kinase
MFLLSLKSRYAAAARLIGLALIAWTVINAGIGPGLHQRHLVVLVLLVVCVVAWFSWIVFPGRLDGTVITPDMYVLAAAGGFLAEASPSSAASAFAFVAVIAAAVRVDLERAWPVTALAAVSLSAAVLIYDNHAIAALAYSLGFVGSMLAASNARQVRLRADQAELLLAQTQRSAEEQLRAARLEESTRIAREIHDVLAHALAGLTIQLEATTALIENGADSDTVLARVRRAHELAREGLRETRRAVGALRGDANSVPEALQALAAEYRSAAEQPAALILTGDRARLAGDAGQAVLRTVQEAMTNVTKHARGAEVSITVGAGQAGEGMTAVIENRLGAVPVAAGSLAASGGGYGLTGMRERAAALGGTLAAGPSEDGWRVALELPAEATG